MAAAKCRKEKQSWSLPDHCYHCKVVITTREILYAGYLGHRGKKTISCSLKKNHYVFQNTKLEIYKADFRELQEKRTGYPSWWDVWLTKTMDVVSHSAVGRIAFSWARDCLAVGRIGAKVVWGWQLPAKLASHVNQEGLLRVVTLILQRKEWRSSSSWV